MTVEPGSRMHSAPSRKMVCDNKIHNLRELMYDIWANLASGLVPAVPIDLVAGDKMRHAPFAPRVSRPVN